MTGETPEIHARLRNLFTAWSDQPAKNIVKLPSSGSERTYFRITGDTRQAIGAYHPNPAENAAFIGFTKHFLSYGLAVPEIYNTDEKNNLYLLEDLGDKTLFSLVHDITAPRGFTEELIQYYRRALDELIRFQVIAGKDLDYSLCYPRAGFDRQSIMWDLNYFKYYFLKPRVSFDEQTLEEDFKTLAEYLLRAGSDYFMYRDFQSRNIMIRDGRLFFIDYQGGRKGPLQYDLASLLFQVRAGITNPVREHLIDHYLSEARKYVPVDVTKFKEYFSGFVLVRLLQVMGAYGFRGLFEKKPHFIQSIPYAIGNLKWWLENMGLPVPLPELIRCLNSLAAEPRYPIKATEPAKLTVSVRSFSYKEGIPHDESGHGGGFVFDCRALPNPGREEKYMSLTGKDHEVIDFLKVKKEVKQFLEAAFLLVDQSTENYLHRGFGHLYVSFGCTGGQHRSVFCAEEMAKHLSEKSRVSVILEHTALSGPIPE